MSLQEIISGNADLDGQSFRGWFVGDLQCWAAQPGWQGQPAAFGLRDTRSVEVKWGIHPQGEHRPGGWAGCTPKTSLSILVQGDFVIHFRSPAEPEQVQTRRIDHPGAYVLWREDVEHTWMANADSIIVTVRWIETAD